MWIPLLKKLWPDNLFFFSEKTGERRSGCVFFRKFADGNPQNAAVAQSVEHQLPKLRVAGSSPVCRSKLIPV